MKNFDSYYDPPDPGLSAIEVIGDWQYQNKITDDDLWIIFEMGKAALAALKETADVPYLRLKGDPVPDDSYYEALPD